MWTAQAYPRRWSHVSEEDMGGVYGLASRTQYLRFSARSLASRAQSEKLQPTTCTASSAKSTSHSLTAGEHRISIPGPIDGPSRVASSDTRVDKGRRRRLAAGTRPGRRLCSPTQANSQHAKMYMYECTYTNAPQAVPGDRHPLRFHPPMLPEAISRETGRHHAAQRLAHS